MKHEANGRVEDLLEGLEQKIEKINRQKRDQLEETRRSLEAMNRLIEAVRQLEYQKRREKSMARRAAVIYDRLEKASGSYRGSFETRSITDAINKILSGARTTGQVIEIVAGSLQAMMEAVRMALKNKPAAARSSSTPGESKVADLSALLKPINTLLNSLITKPQEPVSPVSGKNPEVVEGQDQKKNEPDAVPVVKAIPVQGQPSREKE
ncbi:MAG: hypothetical protein K6T66_00845 [Peptococcaceae bacterium]|nr:hypothetical protein [Peptococcaceae bacterium]